MASYVYRCDDNEIIIERSIAEPETKPTCPDCGKVMARIFSAPPTIFAGNGWGRQAR